MSRLQTFKALLHTSAPFTIVSITVNNSPVVISLDHLAILLQNPDADGRAATVYAQVQKGASAHKMRWKITCISKLNLIMLKKVTYFCQMV